MEAIEIVLVSDDEDTAVPMLKLLRGKFGNSVRYIQDGGRALEYLIFEHDSVPKVILLSPTLPNVDGFEVFNMICMEPASRKLHVWFLVDDERSKEYIESKGLKPEGFLRRPRRNNVDWNTGITTIQNFIQSHPVG